MQQMKCINEVWLKAKHGTSEYLHAQLELVFTGVTSSTARNKDSEGAIIN